MADHVGNWLNGQAQTATPEQVQQGLGSTGLIEKTAEHAGVSTSVVISALAMILPMAIQHFAPSGQAAEQSSFGGVAEQLLGRFMPK